jgi:methyltransferase-like protein
MIDTTAVYTKKEKIPWRVIDNEAVIVDLSGNSVLQLNDVGRYIWEQIDGTTQLSEIVHSIVEEYEIDRETAFTDVTGFIEQLIAKDLVYALSNGIEHSGSAL